MQGARWHGDGLPLTVSVNISARQLQSDALPEDISNALTASGFPAAALVVEISESVLMRDIPATTARLTALKAIGIRIAIDDFGTAYSSLALLQQFPIDILKIDRSFVGASTDPVDGEAILHILVQLGKRLDLQTVAEGIETGDQLHRVQDEHCDSGQGFLVAKPMAADAITAFARSTLSTLATANHTSFAPRAVAEKVAYGEDIELTIPAVSS